MILLRNSEPLIEGGFRDAAAREEGLNAFHDSCGNRKRGPTAILGLMVGTPLNLYMLISWMVLARLPWLRLK